MLEIFIVFGIVGLALAKAGRSFYRTFSAKNDGCGCVKGSCSDACRPTGALKETGVDDR